MAPDWNVVTIDLRVPERSIENQPPEKPCWRRFTIISRHAARYSPHNVFFNVP